jgi:hypothetical protein
MFKSKTIFRLFIAALIVAVVYLMVTKSGYVGYPVKTDIPDSKFDGFFARTFESAQLACNPGSPDKDGKVMSSYYTGNLTPGGFCDDQAAVNSASNYKLVGTEAPLGD